MMVRRRLKRGQVAVETAIVMPLFVFVILGLLQLTLMHQAQLMTKYAAYKAVRAGSIRRGDVDAMKKAARNVLVPVMAQGLTKATSGVFSTNNGGKYAIAYNKIGITYAGLSPVDVKICAPLNTSSTADFDDPKQFGADVKYNSTKSIDWQESDKTKLAIQLTTNFRLSIPFVNGLIFWAAYIGDGRQTTAAQAIHLASKNELARTKTPDAIRLGLAKTSQVYVMPIRASYAMRMQSNFDKTTPSQNDCVIPFAKK